MSDTKKISVPILAWYGDTELEVDFPASWDVSVCTHRGDGTPPLSEAGFRKAFANPIGSKSIREGAKGKKEVCILFDDLSRATPSADIIPYVLEELAAAGIKDSQIRFIAAIGAHGSMTCNDWTKKVGTDVAGRFPIYNHNPYENCNYVGPSSAGTSMRFNAEVLRCDYKIGIGSIVLNGAKIGDGSLVGANTLITEGKEFPPRSMILGSPGKGGDARPDYLGFLRDVPDFYRKGTWARTRLVYFALQFSRPFRAYGCQMDDAAPYRDFYRGSAVAASMPPSERYS